MGRGAGVLIPLLVAPLLVACGAPRGAPGPVADLQPTERPSRGTDEAGLWMQAERAEEQLKTSAILVRDPALQEYVRDVVCRLAGPHCPALRVYVVRHPAFYASMAPNGMMQVATGLLLRTANEAQLAYVLGHELGHYLRRHSMQRWSDFQTKAGNLGPELGRMAAFSRDNEREADQVGFDLMVKSGYDPREAPRAWDRLMAERAASGGSPRDPFLARHPPTAERRETLRDYAARAVVTGEPRVGRDDYLARLRPIRRWLLTDEVRSRRFAASEILLQHLIDDGDGLGELHFHVGEIHRLRGSPGDLPKAIEAYRRALELPDVPPEALRSLGTVYVRTGDHAAARDALARYLERRPDAGDREVIRSQLVDLETSR